MNEREITMKIIFLVLLMGLSVVYSNGYGIGVGSKLEYSDALLEEETGFAVVPHIELLFPANFATWLGHSTRSVKGDDLVTRTQEKWVVEGLWFLVSPVKGPYLKAGFESVSILRNDEFGDVEYELYTVGGGALLSAGELSSIGLFADYVFPFERRKSEVKGEEFVNLNKLRFGFNFKMSIPM
jgi:hypothetical protein